MVKDAPVIGDLAKMAGGAASALNGAREEFRRRAQDRRGRLLQRLDLVTREDADRMEAIAVSALEAQARLAERVKALEARLGALEASQAGTASGKPAPPARKPRSRATAKKAPSAKSSAP